MLFIRYNLIERGRVLDVTVPGAQGGRGGTSILLLEIRCAQRVAQRFVQVDAGLGEEISGVWELHWRACDQRGAGSSRGTVTRGADRTQAGRSTYRHENQYLFIYPIKKKSYKKDQIHFCNYLNPELKSFWYFFVGFKSRWCNCTETAKGL